jgi:hypothetical protein
MKFILNNILRWGISKGIIVSYVQAYNYFCWRFWRKRIIQARKKIEGKCLCCGKCCGNCEYLLRNGLCSIHKNRPYYCRINPLPIHFKLFNIPQGCGYRLRRKK